MGTQPDIIVIGGGAAGLMAAGQAAESGAKVLLVEKMKRPGRKLCITGKGRCNLTNTAKYGNFIEHFGRTGAFLHQAFAAFFSDELIAFFEDLNLNLVIERGGRVFPASGKAPDVLSAMLLWLNRLNVEIRTATEVQKLLVENGQVCGVRAQGQKLSSGAVILTTGGASYQRTGSTGDGYRLAGQVGHNIVPIRPALVPLETKGADSSLADLGLRNIKVRLLINNKKRREAFGEMTFTSFGVTGPVILAMSGEIVDLLRAGHKAVLAIDFKPALDEKKLDNRLLRDFKSRGNESMSSILRGLLPQPLVPVCLRETDIPADRMGHSVLSKERLRLRTWLKDFRMPVTGSRPFEEAIITAGGVNTKEINPVTMESRLCSGLFIAGELLDVSAMTGGYNLQAAFSTGRAAGRAAEKHIKTDV